MMRKIVGFGVLVGTTALSAIASTAAFAQNAPISVGNIEQVVVTAQRRTELQVDVPITVATISQTQLATARIDQLADIAKVTPGLRFDFASGYFQPTIRGVGTAVTTAGGGSNVGIYIDGFYSPNSLMSDFQLMNLQSIQVLKGPQGTLFGRNTTGGAILVQTADPSTDAHVMAKASYGRYNEAKLQGYGTFGLSDKIAVDLEGIYKRGDGWLTDIITNKKVGDYKDWSVRAGVKVQVNDAISVLFRYQHSNQDDPSQLFTASYTESAPSSPLLPFTIANGAAFYSTPGTYTFNPNQTTSTAGAVPKFLRTKADIYQLTIKADLGFADLTSYSQYRHEYTDSSISLSYSALPPQLGLGDGNVTRSQEILLTSKPGGKLQWTAGAFYLSNDDRYYVFFDYLPPFTSTRGFEFGSNGRVQTIAGYLDMTYEVMPNLFLTAGARVAQDSEHDAWTRAAFVPTTTFATSADYSRIKKTKVTPRAVVRYKPSEHSSIYASYARGYKAGFFDLGGGNVLDVAPEKIDAFEVGAKYDSSSLSAELSAFYYDYKNLQVSLYENAAARIRNAAASEIYGLDGTVRYAFDEHFSVNAGGVWLHARYTNFPNAPVYVPCLTLPASNGCAAGGLSYPVVGYNLHDVTMQRSPSFTANVGATYKTEVARGELALSGNLYYTSKFFFGPSGIQFPQKGYAVLSMRLQWTDPSDHYTIAVYGDNLTDERYKTEVQYGNFGIGSNWSKPITYGVEVGAKF